MTLIETIILAEKQVNWGLPVSEYAEILYYTAMQNKLDPAKLKDFNKIITIINKSIKEN